MEIAGKLFAGQVPTRVILACGATIESPENHSILRGARRVFLKKAYTPPGFEIGEDDVVVDIGANIGIFTVFAALKTRNSVYAFEPFSGNVEFLNKNIQNNGLNNVEANTAAVCDKIGTQKLIVAKNSTAHLLANCESGNNSTTLIETPTLTLQHIMDKRNLERIDFLKLDCEGAEGHILQSTPESYLKRINRIVMEFHDKVSPLKHYEMEELLQKIGFTTKLAMVKGKPSGYIFAKR